MRVKRMEEGGLLIFMLSLPSASLHQLRYVCKVGVGEDAHNMSAATNLDIDCVIKLKFCSKLIFLLSLSSSLPFQGDTCAQSGLSGTDQNVYFPMALLYVTSPLISIYLLPPLHEHCTNLSRLEKGTEICIIPEDLCSTENGWQQGNGILSWRNTATTNRKVVY